MTERLAAFFLSVALIFAAGQSFGQLTTLGAGKGAPGGGSATPTTWNPLDKTSNITLSGGDLIATATGNTQGIRSVGSALSGQKVYFEVTPTVNEDNQQYGFALASHDLTNPLDAGHIDGLSFGIIFDGSYHDSGSVDNGTSGPSWVAGNSVEIAYDDGAHTFKWRVGGGTFSADKAVSVTGTLFALCFITYNTEISTARFASTDWLHSAPAGFTQLVN